MNQPFQVKLSAASCKASLNKRNPPKPRTPVLPMATSVTKAMEVKGHDTSWRRRVKNVGHRQQPPLSAAEYHQRALTLQERVSRLNPYPKPRGFVFKAKSWMAYETWKRQQPNPRLW